jgi:hypothetical protein
VAIARRVFRGSLYRLPTGAESAILNSLVDHDQIATTVIPNAASLFSTPRPSTQSTARDAVAHRGELGSPDLAIGKARTSALLRRPSAETESAVNNGRPAFATSGLMTLRGGAPLMAGAKVVGAVGIASLDKDNDVKIAQAAAAAFASLSPGQPAAH